LKRTVTRKVEDTTGKAKEEEKDRGIRGGMEILPPIVQKKKKRKRDWTGERNVSLSL